MTQQNTVSVQNNFVGGLKTEFTGLNFPENACTDTENCNFNIIGNVTRRLGWDFEDNYTTALEDRTSKAISTYKWNNAGGDGNTQIVVKQTGTVLSFYLATSATASSPLSTTKIVNTIDISVFKPTGSTKTIQDTECQYSDGNGYLFVYHPFLDPFYCTYADGVITSTGINLQYRDFDGLIENVPDNQRPPSLSAQHQYNLGNQGWTLGSSWSTNSANLTVTLGVNNFTGVSPGMPVTLGSTVLITLFAGYTNGSGPLSWTAARGIVSAYSGTNMTVNVSNLYPQPPGSYFVISSVISPVNIGYINTWYTAVGLYPSNADVWWNFKNASGIFDPATQLGNTTLGSGPAPKGSYILSIFDQQRGAVSGLSTLASVKTDVRPKTGAWFAGRVWYAGADASVSSTVNNPYYTWSESIYFSQIIINNTQFGKCYQTNDPTSETLFDILPTDGGVIKIQGCGRIHKLFPIQNGMLVFAANGIWFITGSQGIGFSANDYTITKISAIESISSTSFVDVQGLPVFWNEEGIYTVAQAQNGGLVVNSMTVDSIASWFDEIPLSSKKYARGSYNPIEYQIQWIYRSEESTNITSRYEFDGILTYNTYNKAFSPYYLTGIPKVSAINYVAGPGGSTSPSPVFKYLCSYPSSGSYAFTFAEEKSEDYVDWKTYNGVGSDYESYFLTGYSLKGGAVRKFQVQYVYVYSNNETETAYKLQGIWDYSNSGLSGRQPSTQLVNNSLPYFDRQYRRHRIRGNGTVFQLKIISVPGQPFNLDGWAVTETVNGAV